MGAMPGPTQEKENVKEMVAEVVEWILAGTATNDAPSAEVRHDGNVQTEDLVSSQCISARTMERKLDRIRRNGQMQLKSRTQHCLR